MRPKRCRTCAAPFSDTVRKNAAAADAVASGPEWRDSHQESLRENQGVTERGRGKGISISFINTSNRNLSSAWLCQLCGTVKITHSVPKQMNAPTRTYYFRRWGGYWPPLLPPRPLWKRLYLLIHKKFSWVAKDNKAVTLDWGRESMVFLCRPFVLRTINNTPSMLH